MKKFLIALFIIALSLALATVCTASVEEAEEFNLENYVTEKIAPVAAGVITSLVAVFGAFLKIKSTVTSLGASAEAINELKEAASTTLNGIKAELKRGISDVENKIGELPEIKESYKELIASCQRLKEQNLALLEPVKTGFEAIPQAVENGAANKIAALT